MNLLNAVEKKKVEKKYYAYFFSSSSDTAHPLTQLLAATFTGNCFLWWVYLNLFFHFFMEYFSSVFSAFFHPRPASSYHSPKEITRTVRQVERNFKENYDKFPQLYNISELK